MEYTEDVGNMMDKPGISSRRPRKRTGFVETDAWKGHVGDEPQRVAA
jgi:hypothetical protein